MKSTSARGSRHTSVSPRLTRSCSSRKRRSSAVAPVSAYTQLTCRLPVRARAARAPPSGGDETSAYRPESSADASGARLRSTSPTECGAGGRSAHPGSIRAPGRRVAPGRRRRGANRRAAGDSPTGGRAAGRARQAAREHASRPWSGGRADASSRLTRWSACWLRPGGSISVRQSISGARYWSAIQAARASCSGRRTGRGSTRPSIGRVSGTSASSSSRVTTPCTRRLPKGTMTRCPGPTRPSRSGGR